jgi:hypothetical protein
MEPSQKKVYGPDLELTVVNFGPGPLVVRAADYQDAIRLLESVEKSDLNRIARGWKPRRRVREGPED